MRRFLFLLLLVVSMAFWSVTVYADEIDDLNKQINDLKSSLESSKQATASNEKNLQEINTRLQAIKAKVAILEAEIKEKEKAIEEGEKQLAKQKVLLDERIASYYKQAGKSSDSLMQIFMSDNLSKSLRQFFYQKTVLDEDRRAIVRIVVQVKEIETKKAQLLVEQEKLQPIKEEIAKQSEFLSGEVAKSKRYESELQNKIASLTARQQQIIAQKLSSLNLPQSVGSGGALSCADDRKIDPGFGNAFAFFSYGIPHHVGLNQYGAYGRANAGQDFRTILNTYYNNVRLECRTTPSKSIQVDGFGEVNLEEYLKGIYEMPGSWPVEALKAQVVAARTYAIKYTNNGSKSICTTQSCQVYKGGNKGGNWEVAVKQTGADACPDGQGLVLVSNDTNDVISAWYASTFGGYAYTSSDVGWNSTPWTKRLQDTTSQANSFQELTERAYDKDSPCFYSAQGYRTQYNKSAWLKNEEVADIVNVLMLGKRDPSTQKYLAQLDKPNPDGVDTWGPDKVKEELRSRGGSPFSSVNGISIEWDRGSGMTTTVTVSGDAGNQTFSGIEFKAFFNLRAPANIQIVSPLFNVERR